MCDGMIESISKACRAHTSATKLPVLLLLVQAMVSTGQGLGCVRPSTVQHGTTNLTETNKSSFPVGTVLEYHCDPEYLADGPNILTCSTLGHWSSEPPRCIRSDVCQPPYQPENGGYTCHPSSCRRLSHGTVIEYFCYEGYILKGDYKYLTCQYGEWDSQVKLSCLLEQDSDPSLPLGMPALSIVASTASSVALILFLVVLFVLLQLTTLMVKPSSDTPFTSLKSSLCANANVSSLSTDMPLLKEA
uniref:Sushi domain-containing protein n=1 Tax=Mola mola TaxID=94237 RepID=A0A3Q3VU72_MOLML